MTTIAVAALVAAAAAPAAALHPGPGSPRPVSAPAGVRTTVSSSVGTHVAPAGPISPGVGEFTRTGVDPAIQDNWQFPDAFATSVLLQGAAFHAWYLDHRKADYNQVRVGHATSGDGISWNTDTHPLRPNIESDKKWDDGGLQDIAVLFVDGKYRMYFVATNGQHTRNRVGRATSDDGFIWHTRNEQVWAGDDGEISRAGAGPVELTVIFQTKFRMWYSIGDTDGFGKIGYASSDDGLLWNGRADPVYEKQLGIEWDNEAGVFDPNVIYDVSSTTPAYRMWYGGCCHIVEGRPFNSVNGFGEALSLTGITDWEVQSTDPIVAWDFNLPQPKDCDMFSPAVMQKPDNSYLMVWVDRQLVPQNDLCYDFQQGVGHYTEHTLVAIAPATP